MLKVVMISFNLRPFSSFLTMGVFFSLFRAYLSFIHQTMKSHVLTHMFFKGIKQPDLPQAIYKLGLQSANIIISQQAKAKAMRLATFS